MKKMIFAILAIAVTLMSCKKDKAAPAADTIKYMSYTANSTWNYETVNSLTGIITKYTLTSTSRDSTANGKAYHVFTNSSGSANEYYAISGNEYYNFQNLPVSVGGKTVESIYLKDNVAADGTWTQPYTVTTSGVPLTITIVNTITEKGISKTVNSIAYTDVIHVTSSISVSAFGIPLPTGAVTTDVQAYYAKKYGMIQSKNKVVINYSGIVSNTDDETTLKSADIK